MRSDALGLFWEDKPVIKIKKEVIKRTPPERTWEADDYLPYYDEAVAFDIPLYNDQELAYLIQHQSEALMYDIESYENYFCIAFMGHTSRKIVYFECCNEYPLANHEIIKLRWILENALIVGFNSIKYDIVIASLAVAQFSSEYMKRASNMLIEEGMWPKEVLKAFKVKGVHANHIDIIEVAPLSASLKLYSGRLHVKRMQDLPYAPDKLLNRDQQIVTRWYCINDLIDTITLYDALKEELDLRVQLGEEYDLELRSKSDAQIAEAIIGREIKNMTHQWPKKSFVEPGTYYYYEKPHYLSFKSDLLNWVLHKMTTTPLEVGMNGKIYKPEQFDEFKITIGQTTYELGLGGIHSQESKRAVLSDENNTVREVDVTSFYPFIILILQIFPRHLGTIFLRIFGPIVSKRLEAKQTFLKKIADSLKIVINGTFGKLGSVYSILYEPDLLVRVTLSGQLTLLMLIEAFELNGIPVVSANTDGIVTRCPNNKIELMDDLVEQWEKQTGFNMEYETYDAIYSRDVNNYLGLKREPGKDGERQIKVKGIFAKPGLSKNPTNLICIEAVTNFLQYGHMISDTILRCPVFTKFLTVRTVKGGGVQLGEDGEIPEHGTQEELVKLAGYHEYYGGWKLQEQEGMSVISLDEAYKAAREGFKRSTDNTYLGKAIRWYYSTEEQGDLVYAKSGNKVPRSDGARPCMDLPATMPEDIDYEWYIMESYKILEGMGYPLPEYTENA